MLSNELATFPIGQQLKFGDVNLTAQRGLDMMDIVITSFKCAYKL